MIALTDEVKIWLNDYPAEERDGALEDLLTHGCQSGIVGELIYYKETTAFYDNHREEINVLLAEMLDNTGYTSPAELFGDKWDSTDPLALDIQNQNLLAWFGFEEAACTLSESATSNSEEE